MSKPLEFKSQVGHDGVLDLHLALGQSEAGSEVLVTIRPLKSQSLANGEDWHRFVDETYGSCSDLALERQQQGEYEKRESLE